MHFIYLFLVFFILCVNAGDDQTINVCNKPVLPAQARQPAVQRPTINPNLCVDLDPACSEIFKLNAPVQIIPEQLNPYFMKFIKIII